MYVEIPFLQRMVASTLKTPEPRKLAAWDRETIELDELSSSDFEIGAVVGDIRTLVTGGHHWMPINLAYPSVMYGVQKDESPERAIGGLMMSIDCTRFFAGGRELVAQTSILRKPPATELIRSSERATNVVRLKDWVADNLASVDGQVYVRVKEPVLCLDIHGPFHTEQDGYISVKVLAPRHLDDQAYEYGIMSTVGGRHEMLAEAKRLTKKYPGINRIDRGIGEDTFRTMSNSLEDTAEVARRTLVTLAHRLTWSRNAHKVPAPLAQAIKRMFKDPAKNISTWDLEDIADLISENLHAIGFPLGIKAQMALDRWQARPITPPIPNFTGMSPR